MAGGLSAVLIVRDEAPTLEDCLGSLRNVADEIVVVDTGSSDDTREIAARHGARVFEFPWAEDFAAARNEALRHATGRFVLYIDADERVHPVAPADRAALLADDSVVAYKVRFRPRTGFTRYREYRIFRNDPRIRFRGVMHETVVPDIHAVAARDGLRIADCSVTIDHLGYDGDQARKHRRDVPLLRARLERDPEHVYSWTHLGRALASLGDADGARAAWIRGIEAVRRQSKADPSDSLPYTALIQSELRRGVDPADLLDEANARFPGNHVVAWAHGRALMAQGRFAEAIPVFERLTAVDVEDDMDPTARVRHADVRTLGDCVPGALLLPGRPLRGERTILCPGRGLAARRRRLPRPTAARRCSCPACGAGRLIPGGATSPALACPTPGSSRARPRKRSFSPAPAPPSPTRTGRASAGWPAVSGTGAVSSAWQRTTVSCPSSITIWRRPHRERRRPPSLPGCAGGCSSMPGAASRSPGSSRS